MGIDALHVGEIGMAPAADEAIIEYGCSNGYSIVTLDADFHSLLALAEALAHRSSGSEFNDSKRRKPRISFGQSRSESGTNSTPEVS